MARAAEIQRLSLSKYEKDIFFMVQEMEAWFISQPNILKELWREELFAKFENKKPMQIAKPARKLYDCTKKSKRKGGYGKISDGVLLLEKLEASQLEQDFPDFKKLVHRIQTLSKKE